MRRKNNPADMSIREQIEDLKDDICDNVCRYFQDYEGKVSAIKGNDKKLRAEIAEVLDAELAKHCDKCPVARL